MNIGTIDGSRRPWPHKSSRKKRGFKIASIAAAILLVFNGLLIKVISSRTRYSAQKDQICSSSTHVRSFAVERNVVIDDQHHTGEKFQCPVCGQQTSGSFTENYRETGNCEHCGASNRFRQISLVVNGLISANLSQPVTCMNCTFHTSKTASNLAVYNTQCSGALHNILKTLPNYQCSEYFDPHPKNGEIIDGIRNEDLQRLTFPADTFDIVLSSEVFEHIPDPYKAHGEIFRVLKPGGCHIFSVPFIPENFKDKNIAHLDKDGEITWTSAPIFHLDPLRKDGIPVFNIFGIEMLSKICKIGLETSYFRFHSISAGILGHDAYIFLACKR